MLWDRQTSSVFLPLDSASRRMRMICSVVRRVFFTMTPPLPENHRIQNELLYGGPINAMSSRDDGLGCRESSMDLFGKSYNLVRIGQNRFTTDRYLFDAQYVISSVMPRFKNGPRPLPRITGIALHRFPFGRR